MTVGDVIEMLKRAQPDAEIYAYDADAETHMPVTGMVYGGGPAVTLETDDIS